MPDFIYPTNYQLRVIAQEKQARLVENRLGFQIMPMRDVDAASVEWEQWDNYTGLQNVRGLNGEPTRVLRTGSKRFRMLPGYYGEFTRLDEKELTERRTLGDPYRPVNITDLVMSAQDHLLSRRLDRIELIIWTLLTSGTFSVIDGQGALQHTDTYPIQTFTAAVAWATVATATPLADLRAVQLLGRGKGASFGAGAMAIMNRTTYNSMIANANANDLARRFNTVATSVSSLEAVQTVVSSEGLPQIVIYDETYFDNAGATQLFVPNNKVVVVGVRPAGQAVGEYQLTRNVNSQPALRPGAYMRVFDKGEDTVPRNIEVHDGHNGGPAIFFPSALVVMTV